jgi:hypothetical protein
MHVNILRTLITDVFRTHSICTLEITEIYQTILHCTEVIITL